MNKFIFSAFPFLKPSLQKYPRLHTTLLLSPAEVEVAFKDYPSMVRQKLRDHLMLIGTVNEHTYSAFKANTGDDIVAQIAISPMLTDAIRGVLTCQVSAH